MKTSTIIWIVVVIIVVLGGIWWWSSSQAMTPTTPATTTSGAPNIPAGYTVGETSNTSGTTYLVNTNGMALYTYTSDVQGVSNCTGSCATTWPPYSATGTFTEEAPISGTLATITRADGTTQLTYNGLPLYTFTGDTSPGQTNGNGTGGFSLATP